MRFTGRVGRRTLRPGAYRLTARTRAGAAARPVVVEIEPTAPRRSFACGTSADRRAEPFASLLETFSGPPADSPPASNPEGPPAEPAPTGKEPDSGVLPAIRDRLNVPEAFPELVTPASSPSPSWIIGAGAFALLGLSALALLLYVIRFVRRPHAM